MRRHTERDNPVFLAKRVEFGRIVARVAVKNQKSPCSGYAIVYVLFEVL